MGFLLGGAAAQFLAGDDDLLVLDHILSAEIEVLDVERAVGRLAVFAGHLVLPARAVPPAVELQQLGLALLGPRRVQPGRPAEHPELGRAGQAVIGRVTQPVGRRIDAQSAARLQALAQGFPGPLGEPRPFVHPDPVHMQRAESVAVSPGGTEVEDRAVGEFEPEVWFAVNLGLAVFGESHTDHEVRVGVELELDLLDQRVEMPLVGRGDESLAAAVGEGEMQGVGGDADALAHIAPVEVDDILVRAEQVFRLVRPVDPLSPVAVAQVSLSPEDRVRQGLRQFALLGGYPGHQGSLDLKTDPRTVPTISARMCWTASIPSRSRITPSISAAA